MIAPFFLFFTAREHSSEQCLFQQGRKSSRSPLNLNTRCLAVLLSGFQCLRVGIAAFLLIVLALIYYGPSHWLVTARR